MSDDIEKAERILRGECVECGYPDGTHTKECIKNIWTQLELKLSNMNEHILNTKDIAEMLAEHFPHEVGEYIEDKKKDV